MINSNEWHLINRAIKMNISPVEAKSIIESLLFVSSDPLTLKQIRDVFDGVEEKDVRQWIKELQNELENSQRGIQLIEIAHGYRLMTKPHNAQWIQKLMVAKQNLRLTKAGLETLAVIAYRQPLVRAEIETIRGVDCGGVLQTLLERKLIKVIGRKEVVGRPLLYGTTPEFLDQFGLKNLNDLPTLDELTISAVTPIETPENQESDLSIGTPLESENTQFERS